MNREIMAPEVRLIGAENEPLGIVSLAEALRMAERAGRRPGRDRADRRSAGLPADGLRQVQVPGAEEGGTKRSRSRRSSRSRKSSSARAPTTATTRSSCATSRASWRKATSARSRCASAAARWRTRNSACALLERIRDDLGDIDPGRAVPEAGRPADDHGDRAEEEAGAASRAEAGSDARVEQVQIRRLVAAVAMKASASSAVNAAAATAATSGSGPSRRGSIPRRLTSTR